MHIYVCHHDKDKAFLAELNNRLDYKQDRGKITYWERNMLLGGAHIQTIRQEQLNKAEAVIMLISSDYMAAKGELKAEYEQVLAWAEQKEGVLIIPVIVRAFRDWKESEIGKWVPAFDGQPIGSQGNLDEAWDEVMDWITRTLEAYKRATDPNVNFRTLESPQALMIDLARRMQSMEDKIDGLHSKTDDLHQKLDAQFQAILHLSQTQNEELRHIRAHVDNGEFADRNMRDALAWIEEVLLIHLGHQTSEIRSHLDTLKAKELDIKSRFKLTIPIIPFVLQYERDFDDNRPVDKARSIWKEMVGGKLLF